jgi:riboflavin kinase/FMN adenylyltransferase
MTNVGKHPTFGDSQRTVEVYVLDYHSDLYGHELKIDIMARLRSEERFNTVDELKKQITEDIKQGRAILNSRGRN